MEKNISRILMGVTTVLFIRKWIDRKQNRSVYIPKNSEQLLHVERIWQREPGIEKPNSACGPTTAATIVNYFFKTNRIIERVDNHAVLVNTLYKQIGTKPWGTTANKWCKNVQKYLRRYDLFQKVSIKKVNAQNNSLQYCRSIDQGFPTILRFTFNFSKNAFASHHYVIGIGYRVEADKLTVAVIDPDGGEHNSRIHWIDWDINERHMKLIIINNH